MGNKHLAELLIETNKKISAVSDKMLDEKNMHPDRQTLIDEVNSIIRQLDHVVEKLESER